MTLSVSAPLKRRKDATLGVVMSFPKCSDDRHRIAKHALKSHRHRIVRMSCIASYRVASHRRNVTVPSHRHRVVSLSRQSPLHRIGRSKAMHTRLCRACGAKMLHIIRKASTENAQGLLQGQRGMPKSTHKLTCWTQTLQQGTPTGSGDTPLPTKSAKLCQNSTGFTVTAAVWTFMRTPQREF